MKWHTNRRTKLLNSHFLQVFKDEVRIPNDITREYYLTKKADIVVIVATTTANKVVMINEYKYAAGKQMLVLPAGHIENGEDAKKAAKRELLEETGYSGATYKYLGRLFESPVQDLHKVEVVRVTKVKKIKKEDLEASEDITLNLISPKQINAGILCGKIQSCSTISSLALSGLLFKK